MASTEKIISIVLRMKNDMKGLDEATNSLKSLSSQLTSLGTQLTATFTVPLVAAGAAGIKLASDLDKSMHNIGSITKQTDESLAQLSDEFVKMSTDMTKTTDTAKNLADAFYDVVGSGFEGADAMKVLEAATKAASAGATTTQAAVKGLAAVINAYGLSANDATHVSDLLFETVNRGVGTFEELNSSLSNVIPTAAAMNISLEEVMAAMATMSKQGFSFAESSVAINQAMTAFISPTEAMSRAIHELGYNSGQAMIDALGFAGAMQALAKHTGGSTEAMSSLFGNVRAMRAAFSLTGDAAGMFAEDLAAMSDANGATAAAFAEQMKSFDASFKNFMNTWNALLIDIGQTMMPVLAGIMNALVPLIQGFMALPEPVKQIILVFLALLAALGPILIIFGQIAGAISTIMALWPALVAGFGMLAGLIAGILSPLGLFIAGVVLLGTAIVNNWFGLRDGIVSFFSMLVSGFSKVGDAFKAVSAMILEGWSLLFRALGEMGGQLIQGLLNGMAEGFKKLVVWILSKANEMAQAVRNAFGIHSPSKVMEDIGKNVVAGFHKGIEGMGGIGVNVPAAGGGMQGRQPSLAYGGAGGGNVTYYNNFVLPEGTTQQQAREIDRHLAKQAMRRGARKTK